MNTGQTVHALEILDDVVVISSLGDIGNAQKLNKFILGHQFSKTINIVVVFWFHCPTTAVSSKRTGGYGYL